MDVDDCNITVSTCWENNYEQKGYFFLHMPIALMGVVTNTLNLIVLHHKTFKTKVTAYTLLVAMAIADLVGCAVIFPISFCRCLEPIEEWHCYLQQFYDVYIFLPFANGFGTISIWLMVVASLERYMSVAHPLKARKVWTCRFTKCTILACYVCGFAISMPYFFQRQIEKEPPPGYTEWGKSQGAAVYNWTRMLFIKTIPIVVVAVLNILLIYSIRKFNKKRSQSVHQHAWGRNLSSSRHQLQMRVTAMVISISVVYIVCHFLEPLSHPGIFGHFFSMCALFDHGHKALILTTNILETFSYASNFFFYCIFNRQFSNALESLCQCKQQEKQDEIRMVTPPSPKI